MDPVPDPPAYRHRRTRTEPTRMRTRHSIDPDSLPVHAGHLGFLLAALPVIVSSTSAIPALLTLQIANWGPQAPGSSGSLSPCSWSASPLVSSGQAPLSDRLRTPACPAGRSHVLYDRECGLGCSMASPRRGTARRLGASFRASAAGCLRGAGLCHDTGTCSKGDAARTKRSYVTVVFGLAPMLAPSPGRVAAGHDRLAARLRGILALGGLLLLTGGYGVGVDESRDKPMPRS